jgi:hypothetical protein|tara:strand:+ start:62 stop:268 length:207 start_codon:yes stop_codon:yes gene_type:complete
MFIQLSRINISGDTEAVFVNPDQIECFFTFKDTFGGREIEVTKVQFNQGFLLVKEDVGTIASLSYFKD